MSDGRAGTGRPRIPKWPFGVIAAVIAVFLFVQSGYGIIFGKTRSWPHTVHMTVASAYQAIPGERVVAGGNTVGEIKKTEVTKDGRAHLVLGLDDTVWPLPKNSTLSLRMGGTIKFTDRYIEIAKGDSRSVFADNAAIPAKQFQTPVEYNDVFNIFDASTRAGMKKLFENGGPTMIAAAHPLRRALPRAPGALNQGTAVFRDLNHQQRSLSTLVATGAQLSKAVETSNPGVKTLISGAADTFSATERSSRQLGHIVDTGEQANTELTQLLSHASRTLYPATTLARRLQPGLAELDRSAAPLNDTMRQLVAVEKPAVNTLQTIRDDGPTINRLLVDGRRDLLPQVTRTAKLAKPIVGCLRPYTPDIMNFFLNFPAINGGLKDPPIHMLHVAADLWPFTNQESINSKQLGERFPQIKVQFPMPPGTPWNQPWYQPQCGVSKEQTSNAGDSESGTFDPNGSKSTPYQSTVPKYTPGPGPRTAPTRQSPNDK